MNILKKIKKIGGRGSMRDAAFVTRWLLSASMRTTLGRSSVPICKEAAWEKERQDILERANWLCHKIIVEPKKLLEEMPKELGPLYGGEWAIYSCSMLVFALYNISRIYPDTKEMCQREMEKIIPIIMSPEVMAYDTNAWHEDALSTLGGNNSHMTYLSILAWAISNYMLAGGTSHNFDATFDSCCEALHRRMLQSPDLNLMSFPNGIVFLPDMLVTLVALTNYGKLRDDRYSATVKRWVDKARTDWTDKKTGLLISLYSQYRNKRRSSLRGSYSALSTSYLTLVDEDFAREQYEIFRRVFRQNGKFTGIKEYLNKSPKFYFDPDSGPIVNGLSPSGTAFALGAVTYFDDWEFRSHLLRTADIAGTTVKGRRTRHYRLGEIALVGEATVLGMRTNVK